jgi:two-component system, NarL family, invasion response regulator UvrY
MVRILIADDHPFFREGLKKVLSDEPDLKVVGESSNGQEVLDRITKENFDIVIMDISMPGKNGLDVLKEIKQIKPSLPVLILSMYSEDSYAIRALRAGAFGYLTKDSIPEKLIYALRHIFSGRKYITQNIAEKLIDETESKNEKPPHESLSDRELNILCLIGGGKSIKEIADILCVSINTVSTHVMRIKDKLNLKKTVELVHYAIRHNLTD